MMYSRKVPESSSLNLNSVLWLMVGAVLVGILMFTVNFEANRQEQERISDFRDDVADLTRVYEVLPQGRIACLDLAHRLQCASGLDQLSGLSHRGYRGYLGTENAQTAHR